MMSISAELEKLYEQDRTERELLVDEKTNSTFDESFKKRFSKVKRLEDIVDTNEIWNCHYLAYFYHHGDSTADFGKAYTYAARAVEMGSKVTLWLYAATYDRLLISQGNKQKYGTQYKIVDGKKEYFPIQKPVSKEELKKIGIAD